MAKKKKPSRDGNGASKEATAATAAAPDPPDDDDAQFGILAQFIKDLSFESPNAPMSLQEPGENPKLEVNVQVRALRHTDELYEVDLVFTGKAESDAGVIYNVELVYGGMFHVMGIPDEYVLPVLHVDAPTIMYPFLRRIVADTTRDGGFQPLMLDPIDFAQMFQQNSDNAVVQDARPAN